MKESFPTSPMFDQLGTWLMDRGLREAGVEDVIQGFGRGLVEAGVSIYRISLGDLLLHPVFGALDVVWNARDDTINSRTVSRHRYSRGDYWRPRYESRRRLNNQRITRSNYYANHSDRDRSSVRRGTVSNRTARATTAGTPAPPTA